MKKKFLTRKNAKIIPENEIKSLMEQIKIYVEVQRSSYQSIELCSIPPFSELSNSSKTNQLEWDAIQSFKQKTNKSSESFMEQKRQYSLMCRVKRIYGYFWQY